MLICDEGRQSSFWDDRLQGDAHCTHFHLSLSPIHTFFSIWMRWHRCWWNVRGEGGGERVGMTTLNQWPQCSPCPQGTSRWPPRYCPWCYQRHYPLRYLFSWWWTCVLTFYCHWIHAHTVWHIGCFAILHRSPSMFYACTSCVVLINLKGKKEQFCGFRLTSEFSWSHGCIDVAILRKQIEHASKENEINKNICEGINAKW